MLNQLRLFLTAVQFFTRIPVPDRVGHATEQLAQTVRYFPLVGVVVGLMVAGVLWLSAAVLPLSLAILLSMLAGILLTGAFHEDGLSDFADGMGGGYSREKILAIMKDPHAGVYGVIAITFALLLKYQALLALSGVHSLLLLGAVMVAAHAVSRLMAASIMLTQEYVRDDVSARAKPVAQSLSHGSFTIAALTGLAALALPLTAGASIMSLLMACAFALLLRIYLGWKTHKKLGGYTGDCLGAVQQITEVGFYLGLLASW